MTAIAKKLDSRLSRWAPETAKEVERLVAEIIELADNDAFDPVRSREEFRTAGKTRAKSPNTCHERTRGLVASSKSKWAQTLLAERDDRL
jgi:hypothetical protein